MQGDVFPAPHPHAQLQSIQAIQSSDALPIDQPPLTPEQHPHPQIAESGAGMGQVANAQPQGGLILRVAPSVPGGSPELRQPTGPQATDLKCLVKPGGQFSTTCGP